MFIHFQIRTVLFIYARNQRSNGRWRICRQWHTALQAGRSRVRLSMVSLEFFIDIILSVTLWPCVRDRRPERKANNLTSFMCRLSRNLGASTWPPGTLRACPVLYRNCSKCADSGRINREAVRYASLQNCCYVFGSRDFPQLFILKKKRGAWYGS